MTKSPKSSSKLLHFVHQNKQALIVGLLTGALTGFTYIPFPPWAILFNFVPLWWYWLQPQTTRKQVLWSGFFTQFIFNLIGFHWVFHTAHEFGHIPWPFSFIILLLFASLAHLYVPLVGVIFFEIKSKLKAYNNYLQGPQRAGLIILLCGMWELAEIYWPSIFPWHLGYTLLWGNLPLFHWADVIGFQGLSLILLLLNALITYWIQSAQSVTSLFSKIFLRRFLQGLGLAILSFVFLNLGGWLHGKSWKNNHKPTQTVHFLPVQANIGNTEKLMAERGIGFQDFIVDQFIRLSEKAVMEHPEAQVLVWPESAIPDYLDQDYSNRRRPQKIKKFLAQVKKGLITGGYSKEFQFDPTRAGAGEESSYNSLFAFNADGNLVTTPYRKYRLLAFGEYTPFAKWFPYLNEISPAGAGFNIGPGPKMLDYHTFKFAPQLCYESLYPDDSRYSVLSGAQILINITNDSWFGYYSEPYQHLSMTFARAIENRRPLLRVTNTGITSAIDASGNQFKESPLFQEWAEVISLSYEENPALTLFTRYGGFFPLFVLLMTLGGLISVIFQRK